MSTTASATDNVTTTTGSDTTLVTTSTTSTSTPMTLESATKLVESSKEVINQCDQQSSLYKTALRQITSNTSTTNNTDNNNNIVIIKLSKVDPSTTQKDVPSKLVLQLSSPVEEATLYPNKKQPSSEQVTFTSVETGQATISITAYWENNNNNDNESETNYIDVSKFTHELLDVLQTPKQYQTTIVVPLYVKKQSTTTTNDSKDNDIVLCTITFDIVYTPSYKDIREELCNCIGKIATQKAIAREELRKASLQVHALSSSSSSGSNKPTTKPAVKSGFLNKDSKDVDDNTNTTTPNAQQQVDGKLSSKLYQFYQIWYNRMMFTVPIVKNYIFFVSFTIVSHYYGHHLAIPPPV